MVQMPYNTLNCPVPASSLQISPTASLHAPSLADDCESVLDDNVLSSPCNSTMSPTQEAHRRQSFPDVVAFNSDRHHTWSEFPVHSEPSSAGPQQYFFEQNTDSFSRHAALNPPFNQNMHWQLQNGMSACAPPVAFEAAFAPDYDVKDPSIIQHDPIVPQASESNGFGGSSMEAPPPYHAKQQTSTSPQSEHSWESNDHAETPALPKDQFAGVFNSNPPLLRRDGIRKKNARFEIPAERTLRTIDQMIANTTDEQTVKELKQQKRLLRNRQAALDSRQRKKQHTERLEEEKKQTTSIMTDLEEALSDLRIQQLEWTRQRETWMAAEEQYKRYIDDLVMDKEELIRRHTVETTELRRKNAVLTEQVQKLESLSMSTAPSSNGYSTGFEDFGNLTMDSNPWDNFSYEFNEMEPAAIKQETALVMLPKKDATQHAVIHDNGGRTGKDGVTSGLLLMLLLCGAWVASQPDSSASDPSSTSSLIPKMPEDVRVASTAVLESIYQEAGVQPAVDHALERSSSVQTSYNIKDSPNPAGRKSTAFPYQGSSSSPLNTLHHRLITPSAEQHHAQAFGLSAEQYNALSADDDADGEADDDDTTLVNNHQAHAQSSMNGHRRNLRDVLASIRQNKAAGAGAGAGASSSSSSSAGEAYTRSLLWDEISPDVVRDFAKMVQARDAGARTPMA